MSEKKSEPAKTLTIEVTATGLDEIQAKVDRLTASLKEANAALKELSGGAEIKIDLNEINRGLAEVASRR